MLWLCRGGDCRHSRNDLTKSDVLAMLAVAEPVIANVDGGCVTASLSSLTHPSDQTVFCFGVGWLVGYVLEIFTHLMLTHG